MSMPLCNITDSLWVHYVVNNVVVCEVMVVYTWIALDRFTRQMKGFNRFALVVASIVKYNV